MSESMELDSIQLGDRVRRDMGDLAGLAESMRRHGLLHPVVVMRSGLLVAGQRRIDAARMLGWEEIPVTVVDVDDLLSAERDENEVRKDFTPTEAVAIGRLIEEQHRAKLRETRHEKAVAAGLKTAAKAGRRVPADGEMTKRGNVVTRNLSEKQGAGLIAEEAAAKAVGMSRASYYYSKKVVAASESDPVTFGDLPDKMDATGNVAGAYREMKRREAAAANGSEVGDQFETRRDRTRANAHKRRLIDGLSLVNGTCDGFDSLNIERAAAACDSEEIKTYAQMAARCATALRGIARQLKEAGNGEEGTVTAGASIRRGARAADSSTGAA